MKLNQVIILISIIFLNFNCQKESTTVEIPELSAEQETFHRFVHKAYLVDGKYYLSACNRSFQGFEGDGIEKEIHLNDTLMFQSGWQTNVKYIVKELKKDSIKFLWQSSAQSCIIIPGKEEITTIKSEFKSLKIKCHDKREIITNALIEGEKVSAETAKKHISKGRIYLLLTKENIELNYRRNYKEQECLKSISDAFGFKYYPIVFCTPTKKEYQQIVEYNAVVFEHLKAHKKFNFNSIKQMESAIQEKIKDCLNEKFAK